MFTRWAKATCWLAIYRPCHGTPPHVYYKREAEVNGGDRAPVLNVCPHVDDDPVAWMDDEDKEKRKRKKTLAQKKRRLQQQLLVVSTRIFVWGSVNCIRCQPFTFEKKRETAFHTCVFPPTTVRRRIFFSPHIRGWKKRSTVCDSDQHKLVWGCVENPVRVAYSAARMKRIRLRRTRRHVKRGKVKEEKTCLSRFGVEVLARHPSPPGNAPTWIYTG